MLRRRRGILEIFEAMAFPKVAVANAFLPLLNYPEFFITNSEIYETSS